MSLNRNINDEHSILLGTLNSICESSSQAELQDMVFCASLRLTRLYYLNLERIRQKRSEVD